MSDGTKFLVDKLKLFVDKSKEKNDGELTEEKGKKGEFAQKLEFTIMLLLACAILLRNLLRKPAEQAEKGLSNFFGHKTVISFEE